jgi:site-specific DNA recombinase
MDVLDGLVTDALVERLLNPVRLSILLSALVERRAKEPEAVDARLGRLEKEAQEAADRLNRLYRLVEDGLAELDDLLKDRIATLKVERERTGAALERARSASRPNCQISGALIESFSQSMREKLTAGEIPFRKAYIGAIVDKVEVDEHAVRIIGQKDALEHSILHQNSADSRVRSLVRRWRPVGESNSCFSRERAAS